MRLGMAQMSQFEGFINKYNNIQTIKNSLYKVSKNTNITFQNTLVELWDPT